MTVNIIELGRRGALAAMLPGIAVHFGWPWLFVGGLASIVLVLVSPSVRIGLASLTWYRWYLGSLMVATLAMGTLTSLFPSLKNTVLLIWLVFGVALVLLVSPIMLHAHGKGPAELKADEEAFARKAAERNPITAVTVRDHNFRVVKELGPIDVATFDAMWFTKKQVSVDFGDTESDHFKLDIGGGSDPGRWLYKPNGYTSELHPFNQPTFKVQDVERFNTLIGATK